MRCLQPRATRAPTRRPQVDSCKVVWASYSYLREEDNLKVDVMKQAPPTASGKLAASALDMRLKGGAMETIYIGVDFHARQQTICYLTTETGEFVTHELKHQDKDEVRTFYAQFVGRVIVGLEASGYSPDRKS